MNFGSTGRANATSSLTNNRIRSAIMATNVTAIKLPRVNTCVFCGKPAKAKRFCSPGCANRSRADHSHETLWRRFWAKVDKSTGFGPNGDCWHWTARVDGRGYGEIKIAGKYSKAHRLSLFGPDGMADTRYACHHCDNPRCVRPDHLFAGTHLENINDMAKKGRAIWQTRAAKKRAA